MGDLYTSDISFLLVQLIGLYSSVIGVCIDVVFPF
jgi:hypothetical protein